MALSAELLKRLNSEEEPLPKRLKLAENTFCTVDLPIARREDLVLKWLCSIHTADKNVWNCLRRCLQMEHVDIKTEIKKSVIELLIREFRNNGTVCNDTFECCKLLFLNTRMRQYFITEPKVLGQLIKSLLDHVHNYFKQEFISKDERPDETDINLKSTSLKSLMHDTVIHVVENLMQIFKASIGKQNELRAIFMQDILYALCNVINHGHSEKSKRLKAVVHKCTQYIIYVQKHVHNLEDKGDNSVILEELSSILKQHMEITDLQKSTLLYEFIFETAVGIYKLKTSVLDLIFRKLIDSAGVYKREMANSMLKYLNDLTFDFDNEANGITLLQYCQRIIDNVISTESITNIDYELLTQFAYFNPILIEKRIQDIFKKILLQERTPQCVNLFVAILDASIRLRREEKLISQIFISLRQLTSEAPSIMDNEFFSQKFKDNFTKSVNNITNSQAISMLKSLIYYLNVDCMEMLQSDESCVNMAFIKAIIELLIALLDGISMFENTITILSHKKFVHALTDLGNVLSLLIDKALHLKHNKNIIIMLLTAIISWNKAQNVLKYYASEAVTKELVFPISNDCWDQLIQRITDFGEGNCTNTMNDLILYRLRMDETIKNESCIKLNELIGSLQYFWYTMLKHHIEIVPCLSRNETRQLASLLLNYMMLNLDQFNEGMIILKEDCLQESKNFMLSLLDSILLQMSNLIPKSTVTKSIISCIHEKCVLEADCDENVEIENILMTMKEELEQNKWTEIENAISPDLEIPLKVLSQIPLVFLSSNIRTLIFIVVFSICKESNQNANLVALSSSIFLDLLDKPGVDIFRYVNPRLILDECSHRIFQKAVEHSFRNKFSYKTSKNLIKLSDSDCDAMYFLLESMENTRPKLNADDKVLLKKAEAKLIKAMLHVLTNEKTDVKTVRALTLMLKTSFSNKNVNEALINTASSTLCNIFTVDTISSQAADLLEEGLQLAVIIARTPKIFQVSQATIQGIWRTVVKRPCKDLLLPLLALNGPKEFQELIEMLHVQMVKDLSDTRENSLQNIFDIWHAILKTDMSTDRNKVRLAAINNLLQTIQITRIPENCWPSSLKLLQNILSAKHLHLSGNIIDTSIVLCLKATDDVQILACEDVLKVCGILIKVRTNLITDRLPALMLLYRRLIHIIVHSSKIIIDKVEEHTLKCLAIDIEKCTSSLIKLKKDMVRLSPYVIADLLEIFSEASIAGFVKISVQNCISQLISICDQHAISLLSRTLPVSMQEIFKTQLDTFNKFHKFSGKI